MTGLLCLVYMTGKFIFPSRDDGLVTQDSSIAEYPFVNDPTR